MTFIPLINIPKQGYAKIIISQCPIKTQMFLRHYKIKDTELIKIISKNHNILIKQKHRFFLISEPIAKTIKTIQFQENHI